jgi:hypothetical protein
MDQPKTGRRLSFRAALKKGAWTSAVPWLQPLLPAMPQYRRFVWVAQASLRLVPVLSFQRLCGYHGSSLSGDASKQLDGYLSFQNTPGQICVLLGDGWPLDFCAQQGCPLLKLKFETGLR